MSTEIQLQKVVRVASTKWCPAPRRIYKPQVSGKGTALQLNLRLEPEFGVGEDGREFVDFKKSKAKSNGFFMELVPQLPGKNEAGHNTFDWNTPEKKVTAKLGMPDVSKLLVAYENVRQAGKAVPKSMRPKASEQHPEGDPTVVSLFHKLGNKTCAITWTFTDADSSFIRISRSAQQALTIKLLRDEEKQVQEMLDAAIKAFIALGY